MAANSPSPPPSSHETSSDPTTAASPPPTLPDMQGLLKEALKAYEQEDIKKLLFILLQSFAAFATRPSTDASISLPTSIAPELPIVR